MSRAGGCGFGCKCLIRREIKIGENWRVHPFHSANLELKVSKEVWARKTAPFVVHGNGKDNELDTRKTSATAVTGTKKRCLSRKDAGATTAEEARKAAKEVVLQSAADMVRELIARSGGNYLAVKFLFELAGVIGEAREGGTSEPSQLLRYYLEGIRNTKRVSSEANNQAKNESV